MENINEFNKAWKKTCPICITNPNSILWFKNQCNDCNIKEKSNIKYTEKDIKNAYIESAKSWSDLVLTDNDVKESAEKYYNSLNKQD